MNTISKFSLKNGAAIILLCMLVLGYGFYAATQIKQQTFPDLEFPAVAVIAISPGASTEEMESGVTKPIEDSLKNFKGYDSLMSTSSENMSNLFIQFPFGSNMDKLSGEIENALNKINLPDKVKITTQRLSAGAAPIYQAAVFSSKDDADGLASKLENEILPKMKKLEGVSSAVLKGTKSEQLNIVVDKIKAQQNGISLSTIQSAIQALDYGLPLGSVNEEETTIPIRLVGTLQSIEQIKQLPLGAAPNVQVEGAAALQPAGDNIVRLSDIAVITTVSNQNEITRFNGESSFVIEVMKNQDANTADVADEVKQVIASYQEKGDFNVHVIMDQGKEIKESVSTLIKEGLFGALFCILIIFLFLRNIRATLISILSLPISIFATIALMNQMGYSLNIMTLGGIAVSIGRIVDDSIVVIENIYRWRHEKGNEMKGKELAYKATKEVSGAVFSSTIATVVVFAPLAFVHGIIGEFFRPFSLAVVISILSSLLVAVMLIPVLGAKFFQRVKPHKEGGRMADTFEKWIRAALQRKKTVLGVSIVLLVASLSTIPLLGVAFLPAGSVPTATIEITLPAKSERGQTDAVSQKIESYLKGMNGIESYQVSIGGAVSDSLTSGGGKNQASITAQFSSSADMEQMVDKASAELPAIAAAEVAETTVVIREGEQAGLPTGNNIEISLYSNQVDKLAAAAKQVEDLMKQNTELKDIGNNMNEVTPKWVLSLNQKGIDANVNAFAVMSIVNEQLNPMGVGTYKLDDTDRELILTYEQQVTSKDVLENIDIPTAAGMMKLKDIADLKEQKALITVNHEDGLTYAKVSGKIKGSDAGAVTKQVEKDVKSLALPDGVEVKFGGGMDMIIEGFTGLGIAMVVAVGLVFLVMSITFGGLLTPIIIMSSLMFIPVGALGALLITGQALSMSAMIGMLMLVGIVVTNAVVLLDRVEKNRKSGIPLREAIVEASRTRLRPILMTACATMLALVPLALSGSSTSLISGGLAITVIGGLFTSTLLTLIVVPVIYEMAWKKRKAQEVETF
ncbi:efflux RND transporter permease subunit [Paenibacillus eucommiae]|uniref:HAE1 family hydrophobic/amphiphilic exporter-1 n=1 Tax=Paenibacillus eucommiae TaxID=1355755 RepID=A0ABS4J932_9BACL|nr:efflux RND transporter permease subunit [Paenibacillus eucommiae]MBP1996354.1 HAE1 family hydrophobic/amphiphilic exporter-1 [Paenibacillus eucommiae]